jgi:hypothetical protein
VLADVELDGDLQPNVNHAVAGPHGLLFAFALGELAPWRILATRPAGPSDLPSGQPGPPVPAAELQTLLTAAGLPARITSVAWSARVPLQHRRAAHYRTGRLFLVGDAAHVQSPAGGLGMNTGIQDALNLGWKLALAAPGPAAPAIVSRLLDSYEQERRPVAGRVLTLTSILFWAEAGLDPLASFLRRALVPRIAPLATHLLPRRGLVPIGIRRLSQLDVHYRHSPMTVSGRPPGRHGARPGERLPDAPVTVDGHTVRLHALLARPGMHVLLDRDAHPPTGLGPFAHLHRVDDWPGTGALIVRPDGYIGYRTGAAAPGDIAAWLTRTGTGPTPQTLLPLGPRPLRSGAHPEDNRRPPPPATRPCHSQMTGRS